MKKFKITEELLRRFRACPEDLAKFAEIWPRGVMVYDDQEKNFPIVAKAADAGISVTWFIFQLGGTGSTCGCRSCLDQVYGTMDATFRMAGELADIVGILHGDVDKIDKLFDEEKHLLRRYLR